MPGASHTKKIYKKQRQGWFGKKRSWRIPVSLVVLAIIVFIFALIPPPVQWDETDLPQINFDLTQIPTKTAIPHPTDIHGGRIIFTCTRGDFNQLCMINADGSGSTRISSHDAHDYYPVFTPQGNAIVYASLEGGSFDLFMMILKDGKIFRLTENIGNAFSPTVSPDGQRIAFLNKPGELPISLWIVESTGRNPHQIYSGHKDIVSAAWSPSGNKIAFAMAADNDFAYQIFILEADPPNQAPSRISLPMNDVGGSLDWSPDAKLLLFYAGPVNGRNIYQLEVETGTITQLTYGGNNAAAAYSPDGQYIVYNSLRNNNQADLYIMRSDGHSTRQLTIDPEPDWQPDWAP
jgi:Tol biopolymer transport system component